jgi:large conductance mechanosensitive channel
MKGFLKEFKEFAMRGNVIDLAVGVIIGGAFQSIVNSLVNDIIMPLIGLALKGADFATKFVALDGGDYASIEEATEAGVAILTYGNFISAIINFIIMAFVIFLFIKGLNKLTSIGKKPEVVEEAAPTTKVCPFCKSEIAIDATKCAHCTSDVE